jgi:hypothetical protein
VASVELHPEKAAERTKQNRIGQIDPRTPDLGTVR